MHRFYPGPLHRDRFFSLVNKFSQDITFKKLKCINSQIILLKQLLMPVAELVGTMIPMGSLAAFYIALLSLHFMVLGVKIKEKDLYKGKKIQKEDISEGSKASQLCRLLLQGENEICW